MADSIVATDVQANPTTTDAFATVSRKDLKKPLRLLVPTLVLVVYWLATEASYRLEMGMFYRFVTRMVVLLFTVLFFLFFCLTRRYIPFPQRFLVFAMVVGSMIIAGSLSHPQTGVFATAMMGLPIVLTAAVGWLWIAREYSRRVELVGIGVSSVVIFGFVSLLRWDGMDGRQRPELSWRWTASAEERFLQHGALRTSIPEENQRPILIESDQDWSSFRGGNRDSVVTGIVLGDWSKVPPKEAWRRRVGPGWSSVVAIGDYLFTQEQRGDREAVICYRAATGDEIWVHASKGAGDRFNESLSGPGPRATPAFHQGHIYAYGARGQLECLNASTGEAIWTQSLFDLKNGTKSLTDASIPQWGSATSPVIVDDMVVVFAGGTKQNSVLAIELLTGVVRWKTGGGNVSYSSPHVATIAGERQILMHDDEGLSGIRIADGKVLWRHSSPHAGSFQPMLQPHLIADDQVIVNWDSGLLGLQICREGDTWTTKELWTSNRLKPSFNDFAIHQGYLYGFDDGIFCCLDIATGKRLWKHGRYGYGQLLLLPEIGELLVTTESGDVIRVATDPKSHRELGQFKAIDGKTWNHPLLTGGRLVVRNSEEMACFKLGNVFP